MQLSTAVAAPDPTLAASPLPGLPASDPNQGAARDSVPFASFLPGQDKPVSIPAPAKKSADEPSPASAEAAAALWSTWLAALAPSPAATPAVAAGGPGATEETATPAAAPNVGNAQLASGIPGGAIAAFSGRAFFSTPANSGGTAAATGTAATATTVTAGTTKLPAVAAGSGGIPRPTPPAAASGSEKVDTALLPKPAPAAAAGNAAPPAAGTSSEGVPTPAMSGVTELVGADAAAQTAARVPAAGDAAPRKAKDAVGEVAKFAAASAKSPASPSIDTNGEDKKILNVTAKHVTEHEPSLGTGNAMTPPVSATAVKVSPPSPAAPVSATSSAQLQPAPLPAQRVSNADLTVLAHRAVDAVMTATERLDVGNRSTVRLQFSVGDANLSVHVELRAGEIHATFRTDSGDLRSALASEWQAMSGESGRAVRLADPVFAPAAPTEHATGFDGGTAQQRHPGGRAATEDFEASGFGAASSRTTAAEPAAPDSAPAPLRSNLNLYTFA
jgi:hypothetical protein